MSAPANNQIVAIHWINENRIGVTIKNYRNEFESNLDELAVDRDGGNLLHLIAGSWNHRQSTTGSIIKDKLLTADYAFFDVTHDGSDDIIVEKYTWNEIDYQPTSARLLRLNTRTRALSGVLNGVQPEHSLVWLPDANDRPRIVKTQFQGRCVTTFTTTRPVTASRFQPM